MELRHGMEGGLTTRKVLAGLIRKRVSQTRANRSGGLSARQARTTTGGRHARGTVLQTVSDRCVRRVQFEVTASEFMAPERVGGWTGRPFWGQGQQWEVFISPVLRLSSVGCSGYLPLLVRRPTGG